MLKDIRDITIQGANFEALTQLPLFREDNHPAKAVVLYGRNGSGKSTIARAFQRIKGVPPENIQSVSVLDDQGITLALSEVEKAHIYVFDEDYVTKNVRVQEDGLGSIVMLGEQAGLTELINAATAELRSAETVREQKLAILDEYNDPSNPKSPSYYIDKMVALLRRGDGWADKKRRIDQARRNASVTNDTYREFVNLSPTKNRDELVVDYNDVWERFETALSGATKIDTPVPSVPLLFIAYRTDTGNQLLGQVIEHPELSEREQYLLHLVHSGVGEELRNTAREFESPEMVVCPKCLQTLTDQYKSDLIRSIQRVLSEEVENHQKLLQKQMLSELAINLDPFQSLPSYQSCVDQIVALNHCIQYNNELLRAKTTDPYTPIHSILTDIEHPVFALGETLRQLESERLEHNRSVTDITPIKAELTRINNEIAYWDVIDHARQHDVMQSEKDLAEAEFIEAQRACTEKQNHLNDLNAQRDSIDIAIDVINDGLRYIFFSENRMQIRVEDNVYRLMCNGNPVKPKDISVGERNIIGLCYFFAEVLEGRSRENAYSEEYLLILDDPVSSYDHENRVGILSFLKSELSKFLLGNIDTRVLIMTHDLFTAIETEKMYQELKSDCEHRFNRQRSYGFFSKELSNTQIKKLASNRNEYSILLALVYDYARGGANDHEIYIGNLIRQVLEAFSTFEFRKSIDKVSVDDDILSVMEHHQHRDHFRNLMYRLVLNEGSHRYNQTRTMQMDFLSVISEAEKRKTAKEILCFMELLNAPHVKAHLGVDASGVIDGWCEELLATEAGDGLN